MIEGDKWDLWTHIYIGVGGWYIGVELPLGKGRVPSLYNSRLRKWWWKIFNLCEPKKWIGRNIYPHMPTHPTWTHTPLNCPESLLKFLCWIFVSRSYSSYPQLCVLSNRSGRQSHLQTLKALKHTPSTHIMALFLDLDSDQWSVAFWKGVILSQHYSVIRPSATAWSVF